MVLKILNLYACLGGNRYKWGNEHEITAVELDPVLCELYKERFQNDTVICTDAHQYLIDHYKEFDFIWSSPPCPSHSRARFARRNTTTPIYPDMKLYEEIIFLQHHSLDSQKWVVENVIPYYEPLIPGKKRGRHIYWTNFAIPVKIDRNFTGVISTAKNELKLLSEFHDYDFRKYKGTQRVVKIARNLVDYEAGKSILNSAIYAFEQKQNEQLTFDFHEKFN